MRKFALIISTALFIGMAAPAAVIWDNYLSRNPGNDSEWYDGVYALSSERSTLVTNSWTADDAIFDYPVTLTGLSWYGLLEKRQSAEYTGVDVAVYAKNPNQESSNPIAPGAVPVAMFTDLSFSQRDIADSSFDGSGKQYQVYEGTVDLPENVALDPGHYYYSVRVVDNGLGRAYALTTGAGESNPRGGTTMAAFQSTFLYYPDRPNWVYVDQASAMASDYAYRLHGFVPEPASLLLLALGSFALRRR
jgi:hypothetical protein